MKRIVIATMAATVMVATGADAALTKQAWGSAETSKFCQGVGGTTGCAGRVEWQGNDLVLEYRREYGGAAWSNSFNTDYYLTDVPSPANAVGMAFDVSSSYYPTAWAINLDLGAYPPGGISASFVIYHRPELGEGVVSPNGGGGTLSNGELTTWSYFPQLDYTFASGVWSVSMFFPDQWLFDRSALMQRINFFATNTFGGPSNLVDGITRFDNVSWIVSDPFPLRPETPGSAPEPATLALLGLGLVGIAASRRRRLS